MVNKKDRHKKLRSVVFQLLKPPANSRLLRARVVFGLASGDVLLLSDLRLSLAGVENIAQILMLLAWKL